ncbi:hypothetical protein GCM10023257_64170 [Streptomyces hyderabadensis]|uniref:Uncharacterized protein n=1 Tax=Streptomyces hyderabadensis TaxID=598549 RepID=A0ABP9ISL3_9ACTN
MRLYKACISERPHAAQATDGCGAKLQGQLLQGQLGLESLSRTAQAELAGAGKPSVLLL